MKKILFVLVAMLMMGCDIAVDNYLYNKLSGKTLYYGDFSGIETIDDIAPWVNKHIRPREQDTYRDVEEILKDGHGDCNDMALVWINIAYVVFGEKYSMVIVKYERPRAIVDGGLYFNHAVVLIGSECLDVYLNKLVIYETIYYKYSFENIFY